MFSGYKLYSCIKLSKRDGNVCTLTKLDKTPTLMANLEPKNFRE